MRMAGSVTIKDGWAKTYREGLSPNTRSSSAACRVYGTQSGSEMLDYQSLSLSAFPEIQVTPNSSNTQVESFSLLIHLKISMFLPSKNVPGCIASQPRCPLVCLWGLNGTLCHMTIEDISCLWWADKAIGQLKVQAAKLSVSLTGSITDHCDVYSDGVTVLSWSLRQHDWNGSSLVGSCSTLGLPLSCEAITPTK